MLRGGLVNKKPYQASIGLQLLELQVEKPQALKIRSEKLVIELKEGCEKIK